MFFYGQMNITYIFYNYPFVFGLGYTIVFSNIIYFVNFLGLDLLLELTLDNASGRFIAWEFLWTKISKSITFFGKEWELQNYYTKKIINYYQLGHQGNAHNSFLTTWYDTGIIGLLGFITGLLLSFFYSIKNLKVLPILIGIFISSFFESWLSASLNPFTIFLMIITLFYYNEDLEEELVEE